MYINTYTHVSAFDRSYRISVSSVTARLFVHACVCVPDILYIYARVFLVSNNFSARGG